MLHSELSRITGAITAQRSAFWN